MTYGNLIQNKIRHAFGGLFDTLSIERKLCMKGIESTECEI